MLASFVVGCADSPYFSILLREACHALRRKIRHPHRGTSCTSVAGMAILFPLFYLIMYHLGASRSCEGGHCRNVAIRQAAWYGASVALHPQLHGRVCHRAGLSAWTCRPDCSSAWQSSRHDFSDGINTRDDHARRRQFPAILPANADRRRRRACAQVRPAPVRHPPHWYLAYLLLLRRRLSLPRRQRPCCPRPTSRTRRWSRSCPPSPVSP